MAWDSIDGDITIIDKSEFGSNLVEEIKQKEKQQIIQDFINEELGGIPLEKIKLILKKECSEEFI